MNPLITAVVSVLCHCSGLLQVPYLYIQFPARHLFLEGPQTSQIQYIQKQKQNLIFPPKTCLSSCLPDQPKLRTFCVILATSLSISYHIPPIYLIILCSYLYFSIFMTQIWVLLSHNKIKVFSRLVP